MRNSIGFACAQAHGHHQAFSDNSSELFVFIHQYADNFKLYSL